MSTFEIGERIRELRKRHRFTQADVARKIGVSSPTITQWENNQTAPKGDNLLRVASVLGCTPDWLVTGKGHPDDIHENAEAAPRLKGLVPVINEVQAGHWTDIKTGFDEEASEWIPTLHNNSRYAFALRVVGDSMLNPHEKRSLSEGMIVIVDPEKQAKHGSIVVARLENSEKATIKELVIDGDMKYLRPFNPQFPIIPITEGTMIIGTVVSASLDLT